MNRQSVDDDHREGRAGHRLARLRRRVFWLSLSIPVGILSALRPRSIMDRVSMTFVLVGISAHPVWIGLILSYFVGYKLASDADRRLLQLLPGNRRRPVRGPVNWAYHLILPWITFMILFAALYVRLIRANVMETMNEDYVRTARAKGASRAARDGPARAPQQHAARSSRSSAWISGSRSAARSSPRASSTCPGSATRSIDALQLVRPADDHRHRRVLDDLRDRVQLHRRRHATASSTRGSDRADAGARGHRPQDALPHGRRRRQGRLRRELLASTRARRSGSSASPARGRASPSSR